MKKRFRLDSDVNGAERNSERDVQREIALHLELRTREFEALGLSPRPGVEPVVMISDALWKRRFGADNSIVGRQLTLNGAAWTVVACCHRAFAHHFRRRQKYFARYGGQPTAVVDADATAYA